MYNSSYFQSHYPFYTLWRFVSHTERHKGGAHNFAIRLLDTNRHSLFECTSHNYIFSKQSIKAVTKIYVPNNIAMGSGAIISRLNTVYQQVGLPTGGTYPWWYAVGDKARLAGREFQADILGHGMSYTGTQSYTRGESMNYTNICNYS